MIWILSTDQKRMYQGGGLRLLYVARSGTLAFCQSLQQPERVNAPSAQAAGSLETQTQVCSSSPWRAPFSSEMPEQRRDLQVWLHWGR